MFLFSSSVHLSRFKKFKFLFTLKWWGLYFHILNFSITFPLKSGGLLYIHFFSQSPPLLPVSDNSPGASMGHVLYILYYIRDVISDCFCLIFRTLNPTFFFKSLGILKNKRSLGERCSLLGNGRFWKRPKSVFFLNLFTNKQVFCHLYNQTKLLFKN